MTEGVVGKEVTKEVGEMDDRPSIWERLVKGPIGTIVTTIVILILLAIVGSVLEWRGVRWPWSIIVRALWVLATVSFSAALILRLWETLSGG